MAALAKFFGLLSVAGGITAIVVAGYTMFQLQGALAYLTLLYGASAMLSGALIYCLGAAVDHLSAIREYQRRQADLIDRLAARLQG